jgi:hypothetical protein
VIAQKSSSSAEMNSHPVICAAVLAASSGDSP